MQRRYRGPRAVQHSALQLMPMSKCATLLVLVLALVAAACKPTPADPATATPSTPAEPATSGLPDRDPALARRLVRDEGALLLDVRTQGEFDEGHIDGAVLIPHDELPERIEEVVEALGGDKSKPVVVYCGSGKRAGKAKETLTGAGFEAVTNVGGIGDWCEEEPCGSE